ncbi:hypothetical protein WG906_02270 [Pedobacter sp. P351]|uniref:hypothetical protein n=1 Tax=Pedobacter superstes TaxID=3133441 RepID=UPI0030B7EB76
MLRNIYLYSWYAIFCVLFFASCEQGKSKLQRQSFKSVEGIKFIEVRREFDTGLSFSKQGFQQIPEWTLYFLPGDSVKIYSPFEKRYIFYPIYYDHGQVMNFAREWLRLIDVNKDSLVLQLLRVQSKKVNKDLSTVYMRFYSENYIKHVLHANSDSMRKPNARDTLYIRQLIKRANSFPLIADSLFAARNPVEFKSKVKEVTAERSILDKEDLNYSASNEYLYPEYDILIKKAYKDFVYNFSVLVDANGRMTVGSFASMEKEFEASRRRVLQGIIDVYLERFLTVNPGKTLGIPHATEIMLHVKGSKE